MVLPREEMPLILWRHERWASVFAPVTDGDVEVASLLKDMYFDLDVFERRYSKNPELLKRYILMHRLYHHLFSCWFQDKLGEVGVFGDEVAYDEWMVELCEKQEFLDVHHRYKQYYPQYREYVEQNLAKTKRRQKQERILQLHSEAKLAKHVQEEINGLDSYFLEYRRSKDQELTVRIYEIMDRNPEIFEAIDVEIL